MPPAHDAARKLSSTLSAQGAPTESALPPPPCWGCWPQAWASVPVALTGLAVPGSASGQTCEEPAPPLSWPLCPSTRRRGQAGCCHTAEGLCPPAARGGFVLVGVDVGFRMFAPRPLRRPPSPGCPSASSHAPDLLAGPLAHRAPVHCHRPLVPTDRPSHPWTVTELPFRGSQASPEATHGGGGTHKGARAARRGLDHRGAAGADPRPCPGLTHVPDLLTGQV